MLAESHISRVPTGGKWERAAMRTVLDFKNFDLVFGKNGDKGLYIPSHSSSKGEWRKGFISQYSPSGPEQARSIIGGRKSNFETDKSFEENQKLAEKLNNYLSDSSDEKDLFGKCNICKNTFRITDLNKSSTCFECYCEKEKFDPTNVCTDIGVSKDSSPEDQAFGLLMQAKYYLQYCSSDKKDSFEKVIKVLEITEKILLFLGEKAPEELIEEYNEVKSSAVEIEELNTSCATPV